MVSHSCACHHNNFSTNSAIFVNSFVDVLSVYAILLSNTLLVEPEGSTMLTQQWAFRHDIATPTLQPIPLSSKVILYYRILFWFSNFSARILFTLSLPSHSHVDSVVAFFVWMSWQSFMSCKNRKVPCHLIRSTEIVHLLSPFLDRNIFVSISCIRHL
jgi:hypothetical protein